MGASVAGSASMKPRATAQKPSIEKLCYRNLAQRPALKKVQAQLEHRIASGEVTEPQIDDILHRWKHLVFTDDKGSDASLDNAENIPGLAPSSSQLRATKTSALLGDEMGTVLRAEMALLGARPAVRCAFRSCVNRRWHRDVVPPVRRA